MKINRKVLLSLVLGLVSLTAILLGVFNSRLTRLDIPIQYGLQSTLVSNSLGTWRASGGESLGLDGPTQYSQVDLPLNLAGTKHMLSGFTWGGDTRLNAPFSSDFRDFPLLMENGNVQIIKLIGVFNKDPVMVMNIFYLLSFYLSFAGFFFGSLIWNSKSSNLVAALAVLSTLTSYHFVKDQFFACNTLIVPLILGAVLRLIGGRTLSNLTLVCLAVMLSNFGLYPGVFSFGVILFGCVVHPSKDSISYHYLLRFFGLSFFSSGVVFVINIRESAAFWNLSGAPASLKRTAGSIDGWSFRITDLLLFPEYFVQAPKMLNRGVVLIGSTVLGEGSGTFAPLGIIVLCVSVACLGYGLRSDPLRIFKRIELPQAKHDSQHLLFLISVIVLVPVTGAVGGFGSLVNILGFSPIKSWERLSVLFQISSYSLLLLILPGLFLRMREILKNSQKSYKDWIFIASICLLMFSMAITTYSSLPQFYGRGLEAPISQFTSDKDFFSQVESRVSDASVFNFPAEIFPEGPEICRSIPYSSLWGYNFTQNTRWSSAAVRRDAGWQWALNSLPLEDSLNRLADLNFRGVVFDIAGYSKEAWKTIEETFVTKTNVQLLFSKDHRWMFVEIKDVFKNNDVFTGSTGFNRLVRNGEDTLHMSLNEGQLKGSYTCPTR